MVGPGDVDEDLQPEVAEECAKYGEVERCLIYEVIKICLSTPRKLQYIFIILVSGLCLHVEVWHRESPH